MAREVLLYVGEALGKYGFPDGHPFGPDRQDAFCKETLKQGLDKEAKLAAPVTLVMESAVAPLNFRFSTPLPLRVRLFNAPRVPTAAIVPGVSAPPETETLP